MRVLYVAGSGRCGSTLLGTVLDEVDGFFSAGELANLWERGVLERQPCACGRSVETCVVWSEVLQEFAPDGVEDFARQMVSWQARVARWRQLPLLLSGRGRKRLEPALGGYLRGLRRLYRAVAAVTGARVVVDGSKSPAYAQAVVLAHDDVRVLHLVRDPRAVAWSWRREKALVPAETGHRLAMHRKGLLDSVALWVRYNAGAELLRRSAGRGGYRQLTYEEFVAAPAVHVERLVAFAGERGGLPFLEGNTVKVSTNHAISGNPSRFTREVVAIREDDEWRRAMPPRDRLLVEALAWPLRRRYGYR